MANIDELNKQLDKDKSARALVLAQEKFADLLKSSHTEISHWFHDIFKEAEKLREGEAKLLKWVGSNSSIDGIKHAQEEMDGRFYMANYLPSEGLNFELVLVIRELSKFGVARARSSEGPAVEYPEDTIEDSAKESDETTVQRGRRDTPTRTKRAASSKTPTKPVPPNTSACINCRKKQKRCNRGFPCEYCARHDMPCHYPDSVSISSGSAMSIPAVRDEEEHTIFVRVPSGSVGSGGCESRPLSPAGADEEMSDSDYQNTTSTDNE